MPRETPGSEPRKTPGSLNGSRAGDQSIPGPVCRCCGRSADHPKALIVRKSVVSTTVAGPPNVVVEW